MIVLECSGKLQCSWVGLKSPPSPSSSVVWGQRRTVWGKLGWANTSAWFSHLRTRRLFSDRQWVGCNTQGSIGMVHDHVLFFLCCTLICCLFLFSSVSHCMSPTCLVVCVVVCVCVYDNLFETQMRWTGLIHRHTWALLPPPDWLMLCDSDASILCVKVCECQPQ